MEEIKLVTIGSGVIVHSILDNVKITDGSNGIANVRVVTKPVMRLSMPSQIQTAGFMKCKI